MGLIDKLRVTVGGKAKEISGKVAQSYREHVGEELLKKQEELESLQAQLQLRDEKISERETNLKKYYLIPRPYINVPIGLAALAALYFGYQIFTPALHTEASQTRAASPGSIGTPERTEAASSYSTCVTKGIAYYKEIGSYPSLSTREDAHTKVEGMCNRSGNAAFGR